MIKNKTMLTSIFGPWLTHRLNPAGWHCRALWNRNIRATTTCIASYWKDVCVCVRLSFLIWCYLHTNVIKSQTLCVSGWDVSTLYLYRIKPSNICTQLMQELIWLLFDASSFITSNEHWAFWPGISSCVVCLTHNKHCN